MTSLISLDTAYGSRLGGLEGEVVVVGLGRAVVVVGRGLGVLVVVVVERCSLRVSFKKIT